MLKTTTREAVHFVGYTTEKIMQFLQQTHYKKKEWSRNLQIKKYLRDISPNFHVWVLFEIWFKQTKILKFHKVI